MYHAIKHRPEGLAEKAHAAATIMSHETHSRIRRSHSQFLTRLRKKEADNTLSHKGFAGLVFLEEAARLCCSDLELVEFLLLSWMHVAESMNSGTFTMVEEATFDTVVGVFMFAGIKLKVTH